MLPRLRSALTAIALVVGMSGAALADPSALGAVHTFAFDLRDADPALVPSTVNPREIVAIVTETAGDSVRGVILLTEGRWIEIGADRSAPLAGMPVTDAFAALGK